MYQCHRFARPGKGQDTKGPQALVAVLIHSPKPRHCNLPPPAPAPYPAPEVRGHVRTDMPLIVFGMPRFAWVGVGWGQLVRQQVGNSELGFADDVTCHVHALPMTT